MCGRTATTDIDAIRKEILRMHPAMHALLLMEPHYNIPPSRPLPVVCASAEGRVAEMVRWGLIPSWAKDAAIGHKLANARIETAGEKPSFDAAMKQRRCLIFVSGFFEWRAGKPVKQPFYIYRADGHPLALAGLWESWRQPDGTALRTCTILTREPNALMATIHNRMPVVVERADYERWIDPSVHSAPDLPPTAENVLTMHAVGRTVNSPANDGPECVAPLAA